MSANAELVARWEQVQQKTFTNWTNMHLAKRGRKIESLVTDFKDGVSLLYLLSAISDEPVPKHVANPKMKLQCIENINTALRFIEEHGVKLAGTGATEIYDGNTKMTLGMVWCLILRFVVSGLSEEGLSAKEGLLLWCQRKTKGYNNVNVQDFSGSFQDGLAFCALIHRHRPDLLDFDSLNAEDKAGNLDKAFQAAADHLDIPRLLDVEDIVSMPRPDERSIMTYVAQLYKVFSSLDQAESAGRRVSKFVDDLKEVSDLMHDYEARTRALNDAVLGKASELESAALASDYQGTKALISDFRQYKKTQKRTWAGEQSDLQALFTQIQAKLKTMNRPAYHPPAGLLPRDVEANFETLNVAERARRTALNASLRDILNALRKAFANPANAFYDQVVALRAVLGEEFADLEQQLAKYHQSSQELQGLQANLPQIEEAEKACDACNIEENEFTDHTYDDLHFEHEAAVKAFHKAISALEAQIAASKAKTGVSAEQLEEFKKTFQHFDVDHDGTLSRLEFKSVLSGLGLISLDFDGSDKKSDDIFHKVSGGADTVSFDQYVAYMTSITESATSTDALAESFSTIAGGRPYVTASDLKVAGMTQEQIDFLTSSMPAGPDAGSFDYKAWLASQ